MKAEWINVLHSSTEIRTTILCQKEEDYDVNGLPLQQQSCEHGTWLHEKYSIS